MATILDFCTKVKNPYISALNYLKYQSKLTDISIDITIDITNYILTDVTTHIATDILTDLQLNYIFWVLGIFFLIWGIEKCPNGQIL